MGNMIEMTLEQAEKLVENNQNVEWNGWNLELYSPGDSSTVFKKNAAFKNGRWMLKTTIAVNEKGTYVVSNKHVRLSPKDRN